MRTIEDCLQGTDYSKSELEYFMAECYFDYLYFAEHILGFELAEYHKEWFEIFEKFPRVRIMAFRGSGKTNFIAGYYIWKAIFMPQRNILIVSNTFEQAKTVLKVIKNMIAGNDLLKQYMPQSKEATWKATELTLKTGSVFYSKTYGEGVKGLRIDDVFCDEGGQYEDKTIFWTAISPVVQLNRGRIIVAGTPESHIDLLHELAENDEYYAVDYPAEKNGEPLWPQKYTCEPHDIFDKRSLVAVRKEIGELAYMQEFLLVPISAANSLFPYELTLKLLTKEKFLQYGKVNERYYIGADLAISEQGDWTVFTVMHANADGKSIVRSERFRGSGAEQKTKLKRLWEDFRPVRICVDKTGLGEQIVKEMQEEIPNIEPVHFTADEKYKMIMDLRHIIEQGILSIPNSKEDSATYSYTQELLKELNEYTIKVKTDTGKLKFSGGAYDDCVISLALANKASQSLFGDASISFL
jgi:hypothetical protein